MKVVIVGNGIAGNEVAFTIREFDKDIEITIISAEKFPGYAPSALPYFVGGEVSRDAVFRKNFDDYKDKNINLIVDNKAESIDPIAKIVKTVKGGKYSYDKLVLSYGVSPFIPPIKGVEKENVLSFKQLEDADRLFCQKDGTSVVIGSGAIGIVVAEALKKRGCEVFIIELLDWVLPNLFDEPAARRLEKSMKDCGIHVLTGEKVLNINGNTRFTEVMTNKRKIPCDTVVIAAGVVPGNAVAETAGIEVSYGIKVNKKMETNIEDIYACGDCVETIDFSTGENCMYPLMHNAIEQAHVVAGNILGQKVSYPGAYLFTRIHIFDTYAVTFGKTIRNISDLSDIEIFKRESKDGYLRVLLKSGEIVGVQAIGKYTDHIGLFLGAMKRHDNVNTLRKEWKKIVRIGSPHSWIYRKMGLLIGLSALDH